MAARKKSPEKPHFVENLTVTTKGVKHDHVPLKHEIANEAVKSDKNREVSGKREMLVENINTFDKRQSNINIVLTPKSEKTKDEEPVSVITKVSELSTEVLDKEADDKRQLVVGDESHKIATRESLVKATESVQPKSEQRKVVLKTIQLKDATQEKVEAKFEEARATVLKLMKPVIGGEGSKSDFKRGFVERSPLSAASHPDPTEVRNQELSQPGVYSNSKVELQKMIDTSESSRKTTSEVVKSPQLTKTDESNEIMALTATEISTEPKVVILSSGSMKEGNQGTIKILRTSKSLLATPVSSTHGSLSINLSEKCPKEEDAQQQLKITGQPKAPLATSRVVPGLEQSGEVKDVSSPAFRVVTVNVPSTTPVTEPYMLNSSTKLMTDISPESMQQQKSETPSTSSTQRVEKTVRHSVVRTDSTSTSTSKLDHSQSSTTSMPVTKPPRPNSVPFSESLTGRSTSSPKVTLQWSVSNSKKPDNEMISKKVLGKTPTTPEIKMQETSTVKETSKEEDYSYESERVNSVRRAISRVMERDFPGLVVGSSSTAPDSSASHIKTCSMSKSMEDLKGREEIKYSLPAASMLEKASDRERRHSTKDRTCSVHFSDEKPKEAIVTSSTILSSDQVTIRHLLIDGNYRSAPSVTTEPSLLTQSANAANIKDDASSVGRSTWPRGERSVKLYPSRLFSNLDTSFVDVSTQATCPSTSESCFTHAQSAFSKAYVFRGLRYRKLPKSDTVPTKLILCKDRGVGTEEELFQLVQPGDKTVQTSPSGDSDFVTKILEPPKPFGTIEQEVIKRTDGNCSAQAQSSITAVAEEHQVPCVQKTTSPQLAPLCWFTLIVLLTALTYAYFTLRKTQ